MKTLTILQQITPSHNTTKPTPRRAISRFLHHNRDRQWLPPPRARQLRGGGKGFTRIPDAAEEKIGKSITARKEGNYKNDDDEIPKEVRNRVISRILFFFGVPLGTGLAIIQALSVISDQGLWVVPNWLPLLTTFITFGASSLGIAYGTLSASLDAKEEGSLFGIEQVDKNWTEMWKEEDEGADTKQ